MKDLFAGSVRMPAFLRSMMALACALLLCWPAFINGGAFFFPDTSAYVRGADAIVGEITGLETDWSDKRLLYDDAGGNTASASGTPAQGASGADTTAASPIHPVLLNRSIYYGLAIFPFIALFSSLGGVFFQAVLAVFVIRIVLVAFGTDRSRLPLWLLIASALLAAFTSLPYFVSLLMPDVFAGFAVALAAAAVVGWKRLSMPERVGLSGLMVFSAMAHNSHVLLLFALFGMALFLRLMSRTAATGALVIIFLAVLGGLAGERLFAASVTERLGEPPIRPPFLTARFINEGPGYEMLSAKCPGAGFEACGFLDRMPQDSDTFLWDLDPAVGVFSVEPHSVQRRLAQQDFGFALATLRYDPVSVVTHSALSAARQTRLFDLNIFNAPPSGSADEGMVDNLPSSYAEEVRASRYGSGTMPVRVPQFLNVLSAGIAAIALVMAAVFFARARSGLAGKAAIIACMFISGVAANAAIAGALSKPHDRYNVRIVWVLPLAAVGLLAVARGRKPKANDDANA